MSFNSRNISAFPWFTCTTNSPNSTVTVSFAGSGGATTSACNATEVLQTASQSQPVITAKDLPLNYDTYTVLIVDRDASSPWDPSRSPIRHFAIADVSRATLAGDGVGPASNFTLLSAFRGPKPPPGSACHRYYTLVLAQTAGSPSLDPASPITNWNFPLWSQTQGLTLLGVTYFRTQNESFRTTDCDSLVSPSQSPSPPSPPSSSSSSTPSNINSGELAGIIVPLTLLLALVIGWNLRKCFASKVGGPTVSSYTAMDDATTVNPNPLH